MALATNPRLLRTMKNYISILLLSLVCFVGCMRHRHDPRLVTVAGIVADKPKEALARLDSIDAEQLSDGDRVFYDFLTVKGQDKADVPLTKDSLITIVLAATEHDTHADYYPEVQYYGGRVYGEMGDYPKALRHFQNALDKLPPETDQIILRRNVLNQMARLLDDLRLYKEAIPLVEQTLEINRRLNRPEDIVHDLHLLGHIYMHTEEYKKAERYFREAVKDSKDLNIYFRAKSQMLLAAAKSRLGDMDSALKLIRHTPDSVHPFTRCFALSYAADIYLAEGILDTAYAYAHELIYGKNRDNEATGYHVMLSPQMKSRISMEEREIYINGYNEHLKGFFNQNENMQALIQQSYYNYQQHDRDRQAAEESDRKKSFIIFCILIIAVFTGLVAAIWVLRIRNKNKARIIELHEAIDHIEKLKKELKRQHNDLAASEVAQEQVPMKQDLPPAETDATRSDDKQQILRERLKNELFSLYENAKGEALVSPVILLSPAYATLQEHITQKTNIQESAPLWNELEKVVLKSSPRFKKNLDLLTSGKTTLYDWHTALLIKCGVQPLQMAVLFNRAKGTIVSRRDSLCKKMFDKKMGTKMTDAIIRLL